ncbi:type I-C CRISPR-associated protein Cas8c/Csd1 [Desulfuromonas thiophila]|uniref:type I-C CRISPR-associated protein Cas8c/Csd1 n=1 Tax=Desulfuromonas thiophila TaxID=57664 RepID=UPI0029F5470E|nr:type I-C CRISPR-associated protein Cas8c/Csd1 [Desulfuromonas thiophila]
MILHALNSYYQRMLADPDAGMPAFGTSIENISFALVLGEDGSLRAIEDLREGEGKKVKPRKMLVPAALKRSGRTPPPNFLWDNTTFVLGIDSNGNPEQSKLRKAAFLEQLELHCDISDSGIKAVLLFLKSAVGEEIGFRDDWSDICGSNLVFRLDGVPGFIHDRPVAREGLAKWLATREEGSDGQCLVTGKITSIARLHSSIKGVRGAQSMGASLVSFDKSAFQSYGKEQSFNAPVSQEAVFSYTTALNALLISDSRQKISIGDTTYVFWAKRPMPLEPFLADMFAPSEDDGEESAEQDDRKTAKDIHGLLKAIRDGKKPTDFMPELDTEVQFYILGLAPNAARLSIRFWQETSFGDLLEKVGQYYQELNIVRQYDSEPEFPPLWRLLVQTATLGKSENISPVLAGGLTRAMLTGCPYPQNLLPVVLDRIRAEHDVTYFRAALLKAYLLRNTKTEEVPVAFDPDRKDLPYLLGRLFAVLEKAQDDAIPGTNATIKDRYLASAAATPGLVFHLLLKNSNNHIAKLRKDPEKRGWAFNLEQKIEDIISNFSDYPKTLKPEEQGLFMIGYYHQRKANYTSKNKEG